MTQRHLAVRWPALLAAGAVASLALLLALGPGLRADQPKDKAKVDEATEKAPTKADREQRFKEARAKMEKAMEKARKDMEKAKAEMAKAMDEYRKEMQKLAQEGRRTGPGGRFPGRLAGGFTPRDGVRLGILPMPPGPTLRDQLGLPEGKGVVVERVLPNSPAARAGLKEHDILMELNGKAVPSNADALRAMLAGIKKDQAVKAVVLRKGKRETIKGLKLSGATGERPPRPPRRKGIESRLRQRPAQPAEQAVLLASAPVRE